MPEKITYAPLEHTNESDHGTFPWGKGIDGSPWDDQRREFYQWLDEYGIADRIAEKLYRQKYLTEGDMAILIPFHSVPSNPYMFFCGDINVYYSALTKELSDRRKNLFRYGDSIEELRVIQKNRQIQEALDDCPILPEEKNALR